MRDPVSQEASSNSYQHEETSTGAKSEQQASPGTPSTTGTQSVSKPISPKIDNKSQNNRDLKQFEYNSHHLSSKIDQAKTSLSKRIGQLFSSNPMRTEKESKGEEHLSLIENQDSASTYDFSSIHDNRAI